MFSSILKKTHNVLGEPHGYPYQLKVVLYQYNILGGARTMDGGGGGRGHIRDGLARDAC